MEIDLGPDALVAARDAVLARAQGARVGVVLGSGLGAFGDGLGDLLRIPYAEIPHLPRASIPGHPGNLCLGTVGGVRVACLQGRVHLYEGHPPSAVVLGVRLLARTTRHQGTSEP